MSRSFKKHPGFTDAGKYAYIDKRNANKKVRHTEDIPNGSSYKKCFCSYDIVDWRHSYHSYSNLAKEILWDYENGVTSKEELMTSYYRACSK
jgi:hypothetical protein